MKKKFFYSVMFWIIGITCSCQNIGDSRIEQKNKCFEEKMSETKGKELYKTILNAFLDTFEILKEDKENFGLTSYYDMKVDSAIFFKEDSSECLLVVLKISKVRSEKPLMFGHAKIIKGKINKGHWMFTMGLDYDYEKGYFKLYPQNTFENLSRLARYSVMINGHPGENGCDISDEYWFPKDEGN